MVDRGECVYRIQEPNPYKNISNSDIQCEIFYLNQSAKSTFTKRVGVRPRNFGSVFLFRNGFRIFPIGNTDDDWFQMDRQQGLWEHQTLLVKLTSQIISPDELDALRSDAHKTGKKILSPWRDTPPANQPAQKSYIEAKKHEQEAKEEAEKERQARLGAEQVAQEAKEAEKKAEEIAQEAQKRVQFFMSTSSRCQSLAQPPLMMWFKAKVSINHDKQLISLY